MYRQHQAEKKSRISLSSQLPNTNTQNKGPFTIQKVQPIANAEGKHQDINDLVRHLAAEDQDKGGSKTTAADRAALEKEQHDATNFYAVDVETNLARFARGAS